MDRLTVCASDGAYLLVIQAYKAGSKDGRNVHYSAILFRHHQFLPHSDSFIGMLNAYLYPSPAHGLSVS